jgi:hypothetical protein
VPSALALGTYELSEGGIFLKCPVVFPKHLTVQVQKLLPVSNIQEAKSFEPSAAPPLYNMKSRMNVKPHAPTAYAL